MAWSTTSAASRWPTWSASLKGAPDLGTATVGCGLSNRHLYNGNRAKTEEDFRRVVAGQD